MQKRRLRIALGAGFLVLGVSLLAYFATYRSMSPAWSPSDLWNNAMESDHRDGLVYKITDSGNKLLSQMSRSVSVGDELITGSGHHYKIKTVDGFNAQAEFTGMDRELLGYMEEYENITVPVAGQQDWKKRPLACITRTAPSLMCLPTVLKAYPIMAAYLMWGMPWPRN